MQEGTIDLFPKPMEFAEESYHLRPYQRACLEAIQLSLNRGIRRQLVSLPTASGKTVIFAHLPLALGIRRMLVLAHRQELIDQAAHKITTACPDLSVGIEQGPQHAYRHAEVIVASVQSLSRPRRLAKWGPDSFDVVVVDEAHHATAVSYRRILQSLGAGKAGTAGPPLIGFTATPYRGDGHVLAEVFDRVVYEQPLAGMIQDGWLARVRAMRIRSSTDLSDIPVRAGDLAEDVLGERANTDERNSLICSAIEQHAQDRHTILIFCVNVRHVHDLVRQLQERGHLAEGVVGTTTPQDRAGAILHARTGETRILVNCGVFTEGFDLAEIDCIVMGRPTNSALLYAQMLGRGCRPCATSGKKDLLVLDVVDVCGRHALKTAATAFGLREVDLLGEDVLETLAEFGPSSSDGTLLRDGESIADARRKARLRAEVIQGTTMIDTEAEAIDVFSALLPAVDVETPSRFPWVAAGQDVYTIGVFGGGRFRLWRDQLGDWRCRAPAGEVLQCGSVSGVPWAAADRWVKRHAGRWHDRPVWKLIAKDATWRRWLVTPGQVGMLRRLGIAVVPETWNRGTASMLIDTLQRERAAA